MEIGAIRCTIVARPWLWPGCAASLQLQPRSDDWWWSFVSSFIIHISADKDALMGTPVCSYQLLRKAIPWHRIRLTGGSTRRCRCYAPLHSSVHMPRCTACENKRQEMASILHSCSAINRRSTSESESVGGSVEKVIPTFWVLVTPLRIVTYVLAQLVRTYVTTLNKRILFYERAGVRLLCLHDVTITGKFLTSTTVYPR